MERFEYLPKRVCSNKMVFEIEDNIVTNITINQGCAGNTKGIAHLCSGRSIDEVIEKLKGIECGSRGTSCPDQIAIALIEYQEKRKK